MSLDGWSLNNKVDKVRDELIGEIRELKMNFAALYEYLKMMYAKKEQSKGGKNAKKSRTKPAVH